MQRGRATRRSALAGLVMTAAALGAGACASSASLDTTSDPSATTARVAPSTVVGSSTAPTTAPTTTTPASTDATTTPTPAPPLSSVSKSTQTTY